MNIQSRINNLEKHQLFLKVKELSKDFLNKNNFTEVDLPLLSPSLIPESYLEIFKTDNLYEEEKKEELYLIPSPELFLKRLMVAGIGSCYFLGKSFRNNEPVEKKHSYEFTMLEFYRDGGNYLDLMEEIMSLLRFIAKNLFRKEEITYQGQKISLIGCEKIRVAEAFKKYAEINNIFDHKVFFEEAKNKGYRIENINYIDLWSQIYGIEVEPKLGKNGQVTFIYDYPPELAAIVKINEDGIGERFEFYIGGVELGNGGNEGVDIKEYKKRFNDDIKKRKKLKMIDYKADVDFISVLKKLNKSAGIAIGMDRLAMIFADVTDINELKMILIK